MSTNSDHETIEELLRSAIQSERRRIIGLVLAEYAIYQLSGEERIAKALDALATKIEHPPYRESREPGDDDAA